VLNRYIDGGKKRERSILAFAAEDGASIDAPLAQLCRLFFQKRQERFVTSTFHFFDWNAALEDYDCTPAPEPL
jgi:hypothetical protein